MKRSFVLVAACTLALGFATPMHLYSEHAYPGPVAVTRVHPGRPLSADALLLDAGAFPRDFVILKRHLDTTAAAIDGESVLSNLSDPRTASSQGERYQRLGSTASAYEYIDQVGKHLGAASLEVMGTVFPTPAAAAEAATQDLAHLVDEFGCEGGTIPRLPVGQRICNITSIPLYVVIGTAGRVEFIVDAYVSSLLVAHRPIAYAARLGTRLARAETAHVLGVLRSAGEGTAIVRPVPNPAVVTPVLERPGGSVGPEIKVTVDPSPVIQGRPATISATTSRDIVCVLHVTYVSGRQAHDAALRAALTADAGGVTAWTWTPTARDRGPARGTVNCLRNGDDPGLTGRISFTVQ